MASAVFPASLITKVNLPDSAEPGEVEYTLEIAIGAGATPPFTLSVNETDLSKSPATDGFLWIGAGGDREQMRYDTLNDTNDTFNIVERNMDGAGASAHDINDPVFHGPAGKIRNQQNAELIAIEAELGADPRGGFATVDARLDDIEGDVSTNTSNHSSHIADTSPHSAVAAPTANRLALRDGSGRSQFADPSAAADAATKGWVEGLAAFLPTGAIVMYGALAAPSGYLLCDGAEVSRSTFAALFAVISTTYGSGNGSTTFNVPDMRQRFPLGKAVSGTGSALGNTGGAINHTHTSAAHTHNSGTLQAASHTHGAGSLDVDSHSHTDGTLGVASHTHAVGTLVTVSESADVDSQDGFGASATGTHNHTITGATAGASPDVTGSTGSAAPGVGGSTAGATANVTGATASATPGATGSNNPPYLVVNFLIKT